MGFSRQEFWSGLPFPSPGDLPSPGIEPRSLASPALADGCFCVCVSVCVLLLLFFFFFFFYHKCHLTETVSGYCWKDFYKIIKTLYQQSLTYKGHNPGKIFMSSKASDLLSLGPLNICS
ncbi:hypothetical protein R6Z07M_005720 [Ovis aries]